MLRELEYNFGNLNLDDFQIKNLISDEMYSDVFEGIDKRTNKEVEILLFEIRKSEIQIFIQTVISLRILNLPGVCKIIDFNVFFDPKKIFSFFNTQFRINMINGTYFVVVEELYKNGDLDHYLKDYISSEGKNNQFLNPTNRCKIIFRVAHTMKLLHEHGFIHRNLTPSHILLDDNFEPKISFSNCSHFLNKNERTFHIFNKSPFFIAPELITKQDYGYPVDVYSFSIVLYRMFSNELKFSDGFAVNSFKFLNKILKGERLKRPKNIPDNFWDLIKKCWNANPAERPTFSEVIEKLKDDSFGLDEFGMQTDFNELRKYQNKTEEVSSF